MCIRDSVRAEEHFVARCRARKNTAARIRQDVDARLERKVGVMNATEHVIDESGGEGMKAAITLVVDRRVRDVGDHRHHAAVGELDGGRALPGGEAQSQICLLYTS